MARVVVLVRSKPRISGADVTAQAAKCVRDSVAGMLPTCSTVAKKGREQVRGKRERDVETNRQTEKKVLRLKV